MAFTEHEEAALRGILAIYRTQAPSLSDDVAKVAVALYETWDGEANLYSAGERVSYEGTLYACLQNHTSQPDWAPSLALSLWAESFAAAESPSADVVPDWAQPDSTNGYTSGSIVKHSGKTWVSLVDNNVWEPGVVGTETLWREVQHA